MAFVLHWISVGTILLNLLCACGDVGKHIQRFDGLDCTQNIHDIYLRLDCVLS